MRIFLWLLLLVAVPVQAAMLPHFPPLAEKPESRTATGTCLVSGNVSFITGDVRPGIPVQFDNLDSPLLMGPSTVVPSPIRTTIQVKMTLSGQPRATRNPTIAELPVFMPAAMLFPGCFKELERACRTFRRKSTRV